MIDKGKPHVPALLSAEYIRAPCDSYIRQEDMVSFVMTMITDMKTLR